MGHNCVIFLSSLLLHFNTLPECYMVGNLLDTVLWCRVIPSCILVDFTINFDRVVGGYTLVTASCMSVTVFEVLWFDTVHWEVYVTINRFPFICFCYHLIVPNGSWHCRLSCVGLFCCTDFKQTTMGIFMCSRVIYPQRISECPFCSSRLFV